MDILDILMGAGIALIVLCIYGCIRNEWVYRKRLAMIDQDLDLYRSLPSYEAMLYRYFWVWNFEWFINRSKA